MRQQPDSRPADRSVRYDQPDQEIDALTTASNTTDTISNRSRTVSLMNEELARAHIDARLSQARELRRSYSLTRTRQLARRAERATQQARLLLARAL